MLIPPANAESIIQGFIDSQTKLAGNSALQSQYGEAARKRVEQYFDWNGKIDRMLDIYRQSIADDCP